MCRISSPYSTSSPFFINIHPHISVILLMDRQTDCGETVSSAEVTKVMWNDFLTCRNELPSVVAQHRSNRWPQRYPRRIERLDQDDTQSSRRTGCHVPTEKRSFCLSTQIPATELARSPPSCWRHSSAAAKKSAGPSTNRGPLDPASPACPRRLPGMEPPPSRCRPSPPLPPF